MESQIESRVTILETKVPYLADEIEYLSKQISNLDTKVDQIATNLQVLITQRDTAEKSLSRLKTAGLTVTTGLFIGLVAWLAHIALITQAAHAVVS